MSSRRNQASSSAAGDWQVMSGRSNRRNPIPPPLDKGWQWNSRRTSHIPIPAHNHDDDDGEEDNDVAAEEEDEEEDDSSDDLPSDEFDSDSSQKSHNTLRKSRWFEKFVGDIEKLKPEEVTDPERPWRCPACQQGPGQTDRFRGLQPLTIHAKTKGGPRTLHHRALARLLPEELRRKGAAAGGSGPTAGKWKALQDDHDKDRRRILWPPMVVVTNTILERDASYEDEKWIGMGNQELLGYFGDYTVGKASHSYGPRGHRGISLLFFEASARGYLEAKRLHGDFKAQGFGREAWRGGRPVKLFCLGGERQLYGFLAVGQDIDDFNRHTQDEKSKVDFELVSYREMVHEKVAEMTEDNQQLGWYKDMLDREKRLTKTLEESLEIISAKLRQKEEENRILRARTKLQHQENQEEMYSQEEFFKEQIETIHEPRDAIGETFGRLQH